MGWSFGFSDVDVENSFENGLPTRAVKDLDLYEVSVLDREKIPAYEGNLITARSDEKIQYRSEPLLVKLDIKNTVSTTRAETDHLPDPIIDKIDYSKYEKIIQEIKNIF